MLFFSTSPYFCILIFQSIISSILVSSSVSCSYLFLGHPLLLGQSSHCIIICNNSVVFLLRHFLLTSDAALLGLWWFHLRVRLQFLYRVLVSFMPFLINFEAVWLSLLFSLLFLVLIFLLVLFITAVSRTYVVLLNFFVSSIFIFILLFRRLLFLPYA